jgi:hypothetical protein
MVPGKTLGKASRTCRNSDSPSRDIKGLPLCFNYILRFRSGGGQRESAGGACSAWQVGLSLKGKVLKHHEVIYKTIEEIIYYALYLSELFKISTVLFNFSPFFS